MSTPVERLYYTVSQTTHIAPEQMPHYKALAQAKQALLEQLNKLCGPETIPLMDTISSLDGEQEAMREQAVFRAGLELGLELGRLSVQ